MSISALVLVCALAPSPPPEGGSVSAVLQRQTQELFDAITAGASAVWERYLDPDVRYVDESGEVMTKKQMVEGTKPLPDGVSGSIRVTRFDAAVHGGVAVATHVDAEAENFHGHELHCQYRTTDTWMKTPDGWRLIAIARSLRPKQWTKNLLVFAGLVFTYNLLNPDMLPRVLLAFVAFCALSSAGYLWNDLRDVVFVEALPGRDHDQLAVLQPRRV